MIINGHIKEVKIYNNNNNNIFVICDPPRQK